MSFSLKKNANWFVLTLVLFECAFLPWDRIHPTDLPVFVLKFKKKKLLRFNVILDAIKNKYFKILKICLPKQSKLMLRLNTHLIFNFGECIFYVFRLTDEPFIA